MNGLFITGTDTGVGKTHVAAALARLLRRQGRNVCVFKPAATGAARVEGRWLAPDTVQLAWAAGMSQCLERVTPWAFSEPVAPAVAARLHGKPLSIAAMVRAAPAPGPEGVLLVEGVGGLLCPLTEQETVADLARALGLPLVIVARRSLGTLNHTLLTLEAAASRGLPVAGVVVNETNRPDTLAEETNVEELRRRSVPLLAVNAYRPEGEVDDGAALAGVDWWALARRGDRPVSSEEHPGPCKQRRR